MRKAGHDCIGIGVRLFDKFRNQYGQLPLEELDMLTNPETEIRRDLVITGTACVQPSAGLADFILQPRFDI